MGRSPVCPPLPRWHVIPIQFVNVTKTMSWEMGGVFLITCPVGCDGWHMVKYHQPHSSSQEAAWSICDFGMACIQILQGNDTISFSEDSFKKRRFSFSCGLSFIFVVLQSCLTHEAAMSPSDETDLQSNEHCYGPASRLHTLWSTEQTVIGLGLKEKS